MDPLVKQAAPADFLSSVEILSPFPREALERLAAAAESRFFAFGDTVCNAGEPADGLYVIKSGSVRVFSDDHGKEVSMGVRKAGEVFAEIAMLRDYRHELSVRASLKSELLFIPRSAIEPVVARVLAQDFAPGRDAFHANAAHEFLQLGLADFAAQVEQAGHQAASGTERHVIRHELERHRVLRDDRFDRTARDEQQFGLQRGAHR